MFSVETPGIEVLGTPIGTDTYIKEYVEELSQDNKCEGWINDTIFLKWCVWKVTHHFRCRSPWMHLFLIRTTLYAAPDLRDWEDENSHHQILCRQIQEWNLSIYRVCMSENYILDIMSGSMKSIFFFLCQIRPYLFWSKHINAYISTSKKSLALDGALSGRGKKNLLTHNEETSSDIISLSLITPTL